MKILSEIKRIFIIIMFLITCFFIKDFGVVNAVTNSEDIVINTENIIECAKEPSSFFISRRIIDISKILIPGIIFIIGLIMYFNKKSSSKVKKVGLVLIVLVLATVVIALSIYIIGSLWSVKEYM